MPNHWETRFYYFPDITRYQQQLKKKSLIYFMFIIQTKKKGRMGMLT